MDTYQRGYRIKLEKKLFNGFYAINFKNLSVDLE